MRTACVVLTLLLAGCGTKLVDPCAHQAGACLALHIDSSTTITRLSSADVHVTGDALDVDQAVTLQNGAASTELPVALAITFPNISASTNVQLAIVGLLNGSPVGETSVPVTVSPGQHTTMHVQLNQIADNGDGGGNDDMASSDLAGYIPLTVQLAGSGTGTVTGSGVDCAVTSCSGQYPPHTMVTLAATAAANATFSGWSGGGCVGTSTCTVTLDAATTVTATFDWKFVPSHVPLTAYKTDAANLSGVTAIDTHDLTINGAAPPTGITFAFVNGVAVLSVAQWTINSGFSVTGDAPLIVVASGPVLIADSGTVNGAASASTPGPGGNAICSTAGAGESMPAGGGAGGGANYGGGATASTGAAGAVYGTAITSFCGGASGGTGTKANVTDTTCTPAGLGGGGGGAIQISSAVSITVHGTINVAGGGGGGGCAHANPPPQLGHSNAAAGGGGAGGEIFLEAPMIVVDGGTNHFNGLFANGGGGGGPAPSSGTVGSGSDGINSNTAATGGMGSTASDFGGNGAFSPDGITLTAATAPSPTPPGGGGGGVGRIWLRTRATAPSTAGAVLTPAPMIDKTL
jgi:hypothetical protein